MIVALQKIVGSGLFKGAILFLILLSAVIVGIETYDSLMQEHGSLFHFLDRCIILIFTAEILMRIIASGRNLTKFFIDPWNLFDFFIVAAFYIPGSNTQFIAVLRLLRLLRVLRLFTVLPKLQQLVLAMLKSIPSMGYVVLLLFIIFYVYGVIGAFMFSGTDPEHFGNLHLAMMTLFKILTLEGWVEIMNASLQNPQSGILPFLTFGYFMSFILIGAMVIMNLFIGVVISSMAESQAEIIAEGLKLHPQKDVIGQLSALKDKIEDLKKDIATINKSLTGN